MPPVLEQDGDAAIQMLLSFPDVEREAVDYIVTRRRELLPAPPSALELESGGLAGGRVYATDFNTDLCGAATRPSNGFIDDFDIPGWDTWFWHEDIRSLGGVVYGWVPASLVPVADAGFEVIPVCSIWWVDDRKLSALMG